MVSGAQDMPDDAVLDLLVKQVTEGLAPAEQRALDALDGALTSQFSREFERAAAAVSLAGAASPDPLPDAVRARLVERLQQEARSPVGAGVADLERQRRVVAERSAVARPAAARGAAAGWFAAAACLVLALVGWLRPPPTVAPVAQMHEAMPGPPASAPSPPSDADERMRMLADADSLKVTLSATKDPAAPGLSGDAVWDPKAQRGFIHFAGLPPNDPRMVQYQIWIFDGGRDQRYPVDGGVFDVPAGASDVVIPIHAALLVQHAAAFALTAEKPGGVVVSARAHVLALGKAG